MFTNSEALSPFIPHCLEWINTVNEGQNPFAQTEQQIEELYQLAYALYQNQQYQDACHFFRVLILVDPHRIRHWKGFAATLQMQKCYQEALDCYAAIAMRYKESCDAYFYVQVADCYFALKQGEAGLRALQDAQKVAKRNKDNKVIQHVAFMRQRWGNS